MMRVRRCTYAPFCQVEKGCTLCGYMCHTPHGSLRQPTDISCMVASGDRHLLVVEYSTTTVLMPASRGRNLLSRVFPSCVCHTKQVLPNYSSSWWAPYMVPGTQQKHVQESNQKTSATPHKTAYCRRRRGLVGCKKMIEQRFSCESGTRLAPPLRPRFRFGQGRTLISLYPRKPTCVPCAGAAELFSACLVTQFHDCQISKALIMQIIENRPLFPQVSAISTI